MKLKPNKKKKKYRVDYSTRYFIVYPNKLLKKNKEFGLYSFGGPEEIRTLDFYNANVALSQLSYRPVNPIIITRDG